MDRPKLPATQDGPAMQAVIEEYVASLDDHVAMLADRLKREIVEYRAVPADDLGTAAITRAVLAAIVAGEVDADEIEALDELARRRVQQGFPLEAVTRSIQLAARFVVDDLDARAQELGIDARAVLVVQSLCWQFANDAAAAISAVHREMALELARRDSARRSDFLRGVLHGGLDARRIEAEAALYGLDPTSRYHPLRARPADAQQEDALTMAIRRTASTLTHRAVLGVLEGDLVGLVPQRPVVTDQAVALGDACLLTEARQAFAATAPALEAAMAFGRMGVVMLSDLGPLPLALGSSDLADALERQHFEALDREGQTGADIEATIYALLQQDQQVDAVSRALFVHRNTVRYRMGRFRELTGLDLRRTDDFVIAWWLLTRRAARRLGR